MSNQNLEEVRIERIQTVSLQNLLKKVFLQVIFLSLIIKISFSVNNTTQSYSYRSALSDLFSTIDDKGNDVLFLIALFNSQLFFQNSYILD